MSSILACPHCHLKFRVAENSPPQVRCPHCRGVVALAEALSTAAVATGTPISALSGTVDALDAPATEGPSSGPAIAPRYHRSWLLVVLAILLGVGVPGALAALPFWDEAAPRKWLLYAAGVGVVLVLLNLLIAAARRAPRLVRFFGMLSLNVPAYAILALLVASLTGYVSLAGFGIDDWQPVAPPEGHFSMKMPGAARPSELAVEGLPAPMKLFRSKLRGKRESFEVGYAVLPEPIVRAGPKAPNPVNGHLPPGAPKPTIDPRAKVWLDRLEKAILDQSQGKLEQKLPRTIFSQPGFELKIRVPDGRVQMVRGVVTKQRLILASLTAPDLTVNSPDLKTFWRSLNVDDSERGEQMEAIPLRPPTLGGAPAPGAGGGAPNGGRRRPPRTGPARTGRSGQQ